MTAAPNPLGGASFLLQRPPVGAMRLRAQQPTPRPVVDHHQHLFGPLTHSLAPTTPRLDADGLVRLLDAARIERAVVLSTAYQFGNPNRPHIEDEYVKVSRETSGRRSKWRDTVIV